MTNSPYRIWNWVSIEGPVANTKCFNSENTRVDCVSATNTQPWETVPVDRFLSLSQSHWRKANGVHPGNAAQMQALFSTEAIPGNLCGTGPASQINGSGNRFRNEGECDDDNDYYLTEFVGSIQIEDAGIYEFAVDGDDAVQVEVNGNVIAGWYGGHGTCNCNTYSGSVNLGVGNHTIRFRHEETEGGDSYRLKWRQPAAAATVLTDYKVRVRACPANEALRESTCKVYGSSVKPTGILHDFGENERMYFGLLTGSQFNNLEGGVLRRNISSFKDEIDPANGTFRTGVEGIARTLNRFRMIGGGYADSVASNLSSDKNWTWNGGTGNCNANDIGGDILSNGECRMWGNPVGEMMYEALRYYAGAGAPHDGFADGGASQGDTEEDTLGLPTPDWFDPYAESTDRGLGFKACAKPVMTVISDINPSYDSNLPGNPWAAASIDAPDTISDFSLATVGQQIWNAEFGGSRSVFIGQSGTTASDGAPTAKTASSFGSVRGLSPEEPTKEGSYSSAAVAYYGWMKDGRVNELSEEKVRTYAVALASPLPRIEFPVDGNQVSFVPFAKTAGGTFGGGTRKPTNTIVDFYVERIVNLPGQQVDLTEETGNGGRPLAIFRINYEDVEQGNDHDMDAIVRYEFRAQADGTVRVLLTSEYAAGSAIQHMGYIASGTTADGVYLEVRDYDTAQENSPAYIFNTPQGEDAGYCNVSPMPDDCDDLPLVADRVFTPSSNQSAQNLRDPLWYAAKYGGFDDDNDNGVPDTGEWDKDNDGTPDKYFLVTNASNLREQLAAAFSEIVADAAESGGTAASGARRDIGFLAYVPKYNSSDWTGDLLAYRLTPDGELGEEVWSVLDEMPDADERNIFAMIPESTAADADLMPVAFNRNDLDNGGSSAQELLGVSLASDAQVDLLIDYLRGDGSEEIEEGGAFRNRGAPLGDILNSQPEVLNTATYGYSRLSDETAADSYNEFVGDKLDRTPVLFVGANDGMLHAFDASADGANAGQELFAVIPNSVLTDLPALAQPGYLHQYYMDASPVQRDAYIGGSWKTVLVTGQGAGGRSMLALDVTDPAAGFTADDILWEFTDPDLGYTFGQPRIGVLENGDWVAVFGNGYNSDNYEAYLFVVDLETGDLLKKIRMPDGYRGDIDDPNGMSSPELLSADSIIEIDTAYAGDYHGNLWKFDLSGEVGEWDVVGGSPLFTAEDPDGDRQHITGSIGVAPHHLGGQMVFFGTGRYMLDGDNAESDANSVVDSFYGIWDNGDIGTVVPVPSRDSLQQQSFIAENLTTIINRTVTQNPVSWSVKRGWFIDFDLAGAADGERVLGLPTVGLGRVVFTTFTPLGTECEPGGQNWLYILNASTGAGELSAGNFAPDPNDPDPPEVGGCTTGNCEGAGMNLGSGAPTTAPPIVTTPPQPPTEPCAVDDPDCEPPDPGAICTKYCDKIRIGVLTPDGTVDFVILEPGRQSWREIR